MGETQRKGDMDHIEARTRLMDLAVEPARLRLLGRDASPDTAELRAHLATCRECRAELEGWRSTIAAIETAVSTAPADDETPVGSFRELGASDAAVVLPPALRARTLASVQRSASPIRSISAARRPSRLPVWLAVAAALVVVIASGFVAVDRTQQLDRQKAESSAMAAVTADLNLLLQDPGHRVAQLTTPDGKTAGTITWSVSKDSLVVMAQALASPPSGQVYRCRIVSDGTGEIVGEMKFSGSLAYWAGRLGYWGGSFTPGSVFTVSLEPIDGGSGTQVLTATL
jgi:hypothetical protein